MPFSDVYVSTFKNDMDYRQLIIQTAMALQTNKFMQVSVILRRSASPRLTSDEFDRKLRPIDGRFFFKTLMVMM